MRSDEQAAGRESAAAVRLLGGIVQFSFLTIDDDQVPGLIVSLCEVCSQAASVCETMRSQGGSAKPSGGEETGKSPPAGGSPAVGGGVVEAKGEMELCEACLGFFDCVLRYGSIPHDALHPYVATMCLVLGIEKYSRASWRLMTQLLGSQYGQRALRTLLSILDKPQLHEASTFLPFLPYHYRKPIIHSAHGRPPPSAGHSSSLGWRLGAASGLMR